MSDNIAIEELNTAMLDWLAGLFLDQHKDGGFIVCELDRRLPVKGCSIGIAAIGSNTLGAVLNRSPLALDDLISLFQQVDSDSFSTAEGAVVHVLKTPPVYNDGFRVYLFGEPARVEADLRAIRAVLGRVEDLMNASADANKKPAS